MERDIRSCARPRVVPFARAENELELAYSLRTFAEEQQDAADSFDLAFDGEHDIEYWIWNGARLVPALPDEVERIHQREAQARAETQASIGSRNRGESHGVKPMPSHVSRGGPVHAVLETVLRPFRFSSRFARDELGGRD